MGQNKEKSRQYLWKDMDEVTHKTEEMLFPEPLDADSQNPESKNNLILTELYRVEVDHPDRSGGLQYRRDTQQGDHGSQ
jgi:hypothetical protein